MVNVEASEVLRTESEEAMSSLATNESFAMNVSTQDIGELFEYKIDQPISIKRNSSALIPIVQSALEGETASLYNVKTLKQNPMNAVYLTNSTGLTLEGGPITVIENGTYSGEAMTARIKPGEKRFITYAVDLGCRVETKTEEENQAAYQSEILNGEFRVHYKQSKTTKYILTNVSPRPKTIFIEHPIDKNSDKDWKLVNTPNPVETTENYRRFKEIVAAKFKSNGCGFMIATADVLAEKVVGKKLVELHGLEDFRTEIEAELEKFPASRTHCLELCLEALQSAFAAVSRLTD